MSGICFNKVLEQTAGRKVAKEPTRTKEIEKALGKRELDHLKLTPEEITKVEPMVREMLYNLLDQRRRQLEFKEWITLFFIGKGHYKVTNKAYDELVEKGPRQTTELMEQSSSREGSTRTEILRKPTKAEVKEGVRRRIAKMIAEQGAKALYEQGYVDRQAYFDWSDIRIRTEVTKKLLQILGKTPKEITKDDFLDNGLSGLLGRYKNSPYLALVEAGYAYSLEEIEEHANKMEFKTEKIYPWEMDKSPYVYGQEKIRIAATKWLVWKLGKEPKEITTDDFNDNGLGGLLQGRYNNSPYNALLEADQVTTADEEYMRSHRHK